MPLSIHGDRCTTVAEFDDDDVIEGLQRRARDENGNSIFIPQNMSYEDWYNKYVDKEEEIIEKILNNSKNTELKDITKQKIELVEQAFKNNTIKSIVLNTDIKSIKLGGNKAYHKSGDIVLKVNYDNHTVRHEMAHAVDYNYNWLSSEESFIDAIQKDKSLILKNKNLYKSIIKKNSNCIELSDIMSGITNNEVRGRYKHNNKYWKKPHKLEREIFAQMFTAAGNEDIKQLDIFKEYLPNIFREFDNLIRRLL